MPRKVRQLIADLERAGFVNRGGKGSHRNFAHPRGVDARHYQERTYGVPWPQSRIDFMTRKQIKEQAARYVKFVEWSDQDECFIGRCPELMLGGVHGNDEAKVYAELCVAAEEMVELI